MCLSVCVSIRHGCDSLPIFLHTDSTYKESLSPITKFIDVRFMQFWRYHYSWMEHIRYLCVASSCQTAAQKIVLYIMTHFAIIYTFERAPVSITAFPYWHGKQSFPSTIVQCVNTLTVFGNLRPENSVLAFLHLHTTTRTSCK